MTTPKITVRPWVTAHLAPVPTRPTRHNAYAGPVIPTFDQDDTFNRMIDNLCDHMIENGGYRRWDDRVLRDAYAMTLADLAVLGVDHDLLVSLSRRFADERGIPRQSVPVPSDRQPVRNTDTQEM